MHCFTSIGLHSMLMCSGELKLHESPLCIHYSVYVCVLQVTQLVS